MELITAVVPDDFVLYDMSDLHLGSPLCSLGSLKEVIAEIAANPKARVIVKGDAIESILPNDKRYVHTGVMDDYKTPQAQADKVIELFTPIKKKILAWGIGNHCNSADTEILTSEGWVLAKDITYAHAIASVDVVTKRLQYATPLYVGEPVLSSCVTLRSNLKDEYVAHDHRFVWQDSLVSAGDLPVETQNRDYMFGGYCCNRVPPAISLDTIRLLTWVVTDATMLRSGQTKTRVQFKLSKPRKIEALTALLTRMGVSYTYRECKKYGINKLQPYYIRIYGDDARAIYDALGGVKQFPSWFAYLTQEQVPAVIATLGETDGHWHSENMLTVSTVNKWDADTIQLMCIHNNIVAQIAEKENRSGFASTKTQYVISIYKTLDTPIGGYRVLKQSANATFVVPIQSVDGTLVARRNGKVSVTGNCLKLINTVDLGRYMADKLGAPYGAYNFKITFVSKSNGERMFKTYHTHGWGGSQSNAKDDIQRDANMKASLKHKLAKSGHADCIYMSRGHDHQLMIVEPTIQNRLYLTDDGAQIHQHYRQHTNQSANFIPPDARWYATTGSFRKMYMPSGSMATDYAEMAGYAPSEIGYVKLIVRDRNIIDVQKIVV